MVRVSRLWVSRWVWSLDFWALVLGLRAWGLVFRASGLWLRVQASGREVVGLRGIYLRADEVWTLVPPEAPTT